MISLRAKKEKPSLDSLLDELIDNPSEIDSLLIGDVRADTAKASHSVRGLPSFLEVNAFIDKHNRLPSFNADDFAEKSLATRMNSYACHASEYQDLIRYDKHKLINPALCQQLVNAPVKPPQPIEPLFIDNGGGEIDLNVKNTSVQAGLPAAKPIELSAIQSDIDTNSALNISTDTSDTNMDAPTSHPNATQAVNKAIAAPCINITYQKPPVSYTNDLLVEVGSITLNGLLASTVDVRPMSCDDVFLSIDGDYDDEYMQEPDNPKSEHEQPTPDASDDFYLSIDDASEADSTAPVSKAPSQTIDDILDEDLDFLESLCAGEDEYFDISNKYTSGTDKSAPDEIGKQTPCSDFYMYEATFEALHAKLESGELKTVRFSGNNVKQGDSFILNGIIGFVQAVGETRTDNAGNYDPRLHLIFDNGTESNILLRTLTKNLYTDKLGKSIIRSADDFTDFDAHDTVRKIRTGQVYIVRSLSNNPKLRQIPDLYKIGFTKHTAQERTKNASRDTAFLEAPVEIIARADCYDLDPRGLEGLIHNFLAAQRIHVTLTSKDGKQYHPQEWFSINLSDAKKIIKHIVDQTIVDYRMDNTTNRLVAK